MACGLQRSQDGGGRHRWHDIAGNCAEQPTASINLITASMFRLGFFLGAGGGAYLEFAFALRRTSWSARENTEKGQGGVPRHQTFFI